MEESEMGDPAADVIRSIELQLELTKEEHKTLKEELLRLITENQSLAGKLESEYREKIKVTEEGNFPEVLKSEIVLNLQNQLELCRGEKEKTLDLYKTSLKLIEKLEEEVSAQKGNLLCTGESKVSHPSPILTVLEAKLKTTKEHLEISMKEREKLEGEVIKHQTEIAKLTLTLESNNKIIEHQKMKEENWKSRCNKSEQEYALLNATLECVTNSRNELEKKLDEYSTIIRELTHKNNESRRKVEEALDVIERALTEKESGAAREAELREEINKLHMCLEHVIEEAGKKVGAEVEEIRKKYDSDVKELLAELSNAKSELEKKTLENKKISLKHKKLERLTSAKLDKEKISLIKGSETEITLLENQLDSVYRELEMFKVKCEELEKDKKKLERESSELIAKHRTLMKDKESREASLVDTIRGLQSEIERKIEDLNEASRRSEFFLNQLRELQEEKKNPTKTCNCNRLREKIRKLNEIRISQRIELESHVESQMKLNDTWKSEMREITGKLEEVKKEWNRAKAKNKKMASELSAAKKKIFSLEKL